MRKFDPDDPSDLLKGIQEGDARAFHQVHREYHRPLIYYAYKMISSMPAAEDLVSESFYKLFLSRKRMENMGHVREFLYRVTRNSAIDLIRLRIKEKTANSDLLHLAAGDHPEEKQDEFDMIEAELLNKIYQEIENLPEKGKQVFKLYFFEHKTTDEISNLLQISPQTVLNHKSSAVKNLRSKLLFQKLVTVLAIGLSAWMNY
jgi:RNA polymerase sigma-70 factor (ECF subfamily)